MSHLPSVTSSLSKPLHIPIPVRADEPNTGEFRLWSHLRLVDRLPKASVRPSCKDGGPQGAEATATATQVYYLIKESRNPYFTLHRNTTTTPRALV